MYSGAFWWRLPCERDPFKPLFWKQAAHSGYELNLVPRMEQSKTLASKLLNQSVLDLKDELDEVKYGAKSVDLFDLILA